MTEEKREALKKVLSRWALACTVLGVGIFYHPVIPVISVVLAALGTLVLLVWRVLKTEAY